jgi:hypothetical protein
MVRRRWWQLGWAVLAASAALSACFGPQVGTPVPEPPTLDVTKIKLPEGIMPATLGPVGVLGQAGAASPRAVIRLTNLDSGAASVATTADDEGAFQATIVLESGNELRVQAVVAELRSEPVDFTYALGKLVPSERHPCIAVSPGFELAFAESGSRPLVIANSCADPVTIADPRQRLGLADFQLTTALPVDVAAGASGSLDVAFQRADVAEREDVLFLTLTLPGQARRYPLTLFARANSP